MKNADGRQFVHCNLATVALSHLGVDVKPVPGRSVAVHYTGRFQNGTVFDSSVGREPFKFRLGAGQVIPAWDIAVAKVSPFLLIY